MRNKSEMKLTVAGKFRDIFTTEKKFIFLRGGRVSGKTTVAAQDCIYCTIAYPKHDIIIARDSYSDLTNSSYAELRAFIEDQDIAADFQFKTAPLHIWNKKTDCNIYFVGIGGADKHRTKSFKPEHPLSRVLYEEMQQIKEMENLEQAHASFRRHLDTDIGKFVHIYNPPAQNSHWTNIYWNIKRNDVDWLCINSDYRDIVKFINDIDLKEILKMKFADQQRYEWLYLGKTGGGFGSVYPQFKREKHLKPAMDIIDKYANTKGLQLSEENKLLRFSQAIQAVIIGGDGAVTHDATSFIAMFLMTNGRIVVPEIFHYDPLKDGQKASAELFPYIDKWLKFLEKKYHIYFHVPIIFTIDSAASELIRTVRYHLTDRYEVYGYGKQTILDMVGTVQSTLSRNIVEIMEFAGYHNWVTDRNTLDESPLVVALENLIWNDAQTGYDKSVPNDDSDAFTYGINMIFRNPHNLYFIQQYNANRDDYYELEITQD